MATHTSVTTIPDTAIAAFARDAVHCGGKSVQDFESQLPEQLFYNDVGRKWATITQRPIAAHTVAQLRWIMCDETNTLFRRAELDHSYYVQRDATQLHHLRLVLGQLTNILYAHGAAERPGVESLQNRITEIEKEILASSDLRDWGWDKLALTGALWAGGVLGSFIFLSAAFGVGVHKAPMIYAAASKKWRSWRDKNDNDPKPPAASGGAGAGTAATANTPNLHVVPRTAITPATWKGWDPSAKGYAQDDWAGTFLTGVAIFAAIKALPAAVAAGARAAVAQPQTQPRPEPAPLPGGGLLAY